MGCGASSESAPVEKFGSVGKADEEASHTRDHPAPQDSYEPLDSARSATSEGSVPASVKQGTASSDALLKRGYDKQFIHPLAADPVPWSQQLRDSASNVDKM